MIPLVDQSICEWDTATFFFFSDNIWGNFIYYSHLFPSLSGLLIALFLFRHNPKSKSVQALLFTVLMFTIWSLLDLILWASENSDLIMFVWSSLIYFELLVYVGALYFVYAFLSGSYPKLYLEGIIFVLFIPLFLFGHTNLNLLGFDFTNCWREALEGPLWQYYIYNVELLLAVWIFVYGLYSYLKSTDRKKRKEIILVSTGILLFLLSFSFGNITGSLETDWELGQIGIFGMPVLVAFLTYLIVRYEAFQAKILSTEALVSGVIILIGSLMFVQRIENVQTIALLTLLMTTALGVLLIKSVRKEVKQREEIEKLAKRLENANKRLKILDQMKSEFVSIASHQLRSPLTSIRGYTSMLLEGTYGNLSVKATEAIQRIAESSRFMAESVEDYLNVSRIQAGNMKYELSDFNLRDVAEHIADDIRPEAIRKGLLLTFKTDLTFKGIVNADIGKTQQIIHNLINNSLKYTPKGYIEIKVRESKRPKKIFVDIKDSGIGIKPETIEKLFGKFERADNANSVNVSGTGLGLYIAHKMAEDMGGAIHAHSDGEGAGSTFTLELPLQM